MKAEKIYEEKYEDIPKGEKERYIYLIKDVKNVQRLEREVESRIQEISAIGWKRYSYTIYLVPKATPRPRYTKNGGFMYVIGASDNKKYFRKMIAETDWTIITTPTIFECKCYFPIPNSMSMKDKVLAEKGYIHYISIPDFDNLAKTYTDMLKGVLLYDDRLVYKGIIEKRYSIKPRIEVNLHFMEQHDSNYNYKKIMHVAKKIDRIKKGNTG